MTEKVGEEEQTGFVVEDNAWKVNRCVKDRANGIFLEKIGEEEISITVFAEGEGSVWINKPIFFGEDGLVAG